jgi:hypothetical protein
MEGKKLWMQQAREAKVLRNFKSFGRSKHINIKKMSAARASAAKRSTMG